MITGQGGNMGALLGSDGTLLVDDQYAPLTEKILAAVRSAGGGPVRFVVNTHWHADHTGGNENLGRGGAVIVAHDNVRQRLSTGQFIEAFNHRVEPAPAAALPVVTFAEGVTFHLNGETVRVFHVPPAHTDGDAVIHFLDSNVLHTGDLMFNGMYPFIDVDSGGSVRGAIAAVERMLELVGPETRIVPGHGPLADRAALVTYRDMLRDITDRVQALIDQGRSRDEVIAAKPTAAYDERWGGGFFEPDAFVGMVHDGLKR
jgi:glyoxylase-like metal-dependent hydrolase (beta-lactamase superfamily II)